MSAYIIVRMHITDEAKIQKYREATPPALEKYGATFIARSNDVLTLEGEKETRRVIIIKFDSMEKAKGFYYSSEYQEAMKEREGGAEVEFIALEGV